VAPEVAAAATARPKDAAVILKEKHAQLQALQEAILKAPRAERKAMKKEVDTLDEEIAVLNAAFLRPVDATLESLEAAASEESATQALRTLKELTADISNPLMLKRCEEFGEKGIFDKLDQVLTQYGVNVSVAEEACAALSHLARSPKNRESMGEKMIPQVQEAMLHHVDSVLVQQAACRTVTNLSLQHPANALVLMPIGTMVVKAMQKHPDDTKMQLFGCLALNNLAINTTALPSWEGEANEHVSIMVMKSRFAENTAVQQWAKSFMLVCDKRRAGNTEASAKVTNIKADD